MSVIDNNNASATYGKGYEIAESVMDAIVDTAQTAVPALAMIARGKNPGNITYEWIVDYLGSYPDSSGAIQYRGEGEDANASAVDARTRLFNRTSIIGDAWAVTHTEQSVRQYGIADEFDYQAERMLRKLTRQANWDLVNGILDVDSNGPNTGSAGNKRKQGGLKTQITSISNHYGHSTTLASDAQPTNTAQAASAFAQSDLTGIQSSVWAKGGTPNGGHQVLCGPTVKELFSKSWSSTATSTSIYRRQFGSPEMMIVLPVDHIVTDFGDLWLHLDPSIASGEAIGFDPEFWELNVLRDWEVIELAKVGHSQQGSAEIEFTNSLIAPNTAWRLHSIVE